MALLSRIYFNAVFGGLGGLLGWVLFGIFGDKNAATDRQQLLQLIIGGGLIGGAIVGLVTVLGKGSSDSSGHVWGGAAGLVILGACIGAFSALVQGVFQPASVKVIRGWQEGREYALLKTDNVLGRDEAADIALFRDMRVEKRHALIQREGSRFLLLNSESPPEQPRVNGEPVTSLRNLQDGDRIQLGDIVLR